MLDRRNQRQSYEKRRSGADLALRPDHAALSLHNTFGNEQPEAPSFARRFVGLPVALEQVGEACGGDAGTGVSHRHQGVAPEAVADRTMLPPSGTNLTAFPIRLENTCIIRSRSQRTLNGGGGTSILISICLSCVSGAESSIASSNRSPISCSRESIASRPVSMLPTSSRSSIIRRI